MSDNMGKENESKDKENLSYKTSARSVSPCPTKTPRQDSMSQKKTSETFVVAHARTELRGDPERKVETKHQRPHLATHHVHPGAGYRSAQARRDVLSHNA